MELSISLFLTETVVGEAVEPSRSFSLREVGPHSNPSRSRLRGRTGIVRTRQRL